MRASTLAGLSTVLACLGLAGAASGAGHGSPRGPGHPIDDECGGWYDNTEHGPAFRSVKDFGAAGDGVTDDTGSIQAAVDHARGGNLAKRPAVVYVPPGTYRVSDTITLPYYTQLIGSAVCPPMLALADSAPGFGNATGLKPLLVAWNAFDTPETDHAWWEDKQDANMLFYVEVHNINITLGSGNPGAVGILWAVAQQTSLRNITIHAGDAAVGLDVGLGCGYAAKGGGCVTPGGGGTVEDIVVHGGRVSMRAGASQWFLRNIRLTGASEVGLQMTKQSWSFVFLGLDVSECPVGLQYAQGENLALLDSSFTDVSTRRRCTEWGIAAHAHAPEERKRIATAAGISNGTAIVTEGAPGLLLDRVAFTGVPWAVNKALPCGGMVRAWRQGRAYSAGSLLPSASGPVDPVRLDTALPSWPRSVAPTPVWNVYSSGAKGDGVSDDTDALRNALNLGHPHGPSAALPLHVPPLKHLILLPLVSLDPPAAGTYIVRGTLTVPGSTHLIGEGLTVIALADDAPGFSSCATPLPMMEAAGPGVVLMDLTLTSGRGNCAILLEGFGPPSDVLQPPQLTSGSSWAGLSLFD
eukprot:gene3639-4071_t